MELLELADYRVYFGHPNSVGLEVVAPNERGARIAAMTILKNNRGDRSWDPKSCVGWEDGQSAMSPPPSKDFGHFPKIVKVVEL